MGLSLLCGHRGHSTLFTEATNGPVSPLWSQRPFDDVHLGYRRACLSSVVTEAIRRCSLRLQMGLSLLCGHRGHSMLFTKATDGPVSPLDLKGQSTLFTDAV